jgi:hypothetical protein
MGCDAVVLRSVAVGADAVKPVSDQHGEKFWSLVHEGVAGTLDHREGGSWIAFEQVDGVDIPGRGVASSSCNQGRQGAWIRPEINCPVGKDAAQRSLVYQCPRRRDALAIAASGRRCAHDEVLIEPSPL